MNEREYNGNEEYVGVVWVNESKMGQIYLKIEINGKKYIARFKKTRPIRKLPGAGATHLMDIGEHLGVLPHAENRTQAPPQQAHTSRQENNNSYDRGRSYQNHSDENIPF